MSVTNTFDVGNLAPRRIILLLLALNVFLACGLCAFALGYYGASRPHSKNGPAHRIEMLETRLSSDNAHVLHSEFLKKSEAVEQANESFRHSRESVRVALRAEPYDPNATREAMSEAETAHQRVQQLLQDVIASAAAKMTSQGRAALADWPPRGRATTGEEQRRDRSKLQ